MDSSQFSDSQPGFDFIEQMDSHGATCDSFRVKIYGKLHFLKRLKKEYAGDIRYQEALRKEFETGYRLGIGVLFLIGYLLYLYGQT